MLALSEIINNAVDLDTKEEKAAYLQKYNCKELRNILKITYDKNLRLNIPSTKPPYTPSTFPDSHGLLYREARKLTYFVEGYSGDQLDSTRREAVFIQMLESVDPEDAKLLLKMIAQKPIKGLPRTVIDMAFPTLLPPKAKG